MPIEFHCPKCNRLVRTPDQTAGKKGKCPQCGALIQIPSPAPASPARPAPPPRAASAEPIQFACPACGRVVRTPPATAGKKGKCPGCGRLVQIPARSTAAPAAGASSGAPVDDLFADLPGADGDVAPFAPAGWVDPSAVARARRKKEKRERKEKGPRPKRRRDYGPRDGLPWEAKPPGSKFWATAFKVLFSPQAAFRLMNRQGGIGQPLAFAVSGALLGAGITAVFLALLMGVQLAIAVVKQMQAGGVSGAAVGRAAGIMGIEWAVALVVLIVGGVIVVIVGSFLGAALHHIVLMIMDAVDFGFETTYRVVAYCQGAMGCLLVVPVLGAIAAVIAYPIVLILGLAEAQETTSGKAAAAVLIPLAVCGLCGLVFLMMSVGAIHHAIQAVREAAAQAM